MTNKFVPESVLVKLTVGQRVRYVPDGECHYPSTSNSHAGKYGATSHEALMEAEGKTGVIKDTDDVRARNGHCYNVVMDSPYYFGKKQWTSILAAAHELALVED